jgi:hypothetical protein
MEANVNGPALGYLKAAVPRNRAGDYGVYGPAEIMPSFRPTSAPTRFASNAIVG